jgi:hypothetical protein
MQQLDALVAVILMLNKQRSGWPPTDAPARAQALATATGALDEPASEESASEPAPAAPTPSGTARDDLLPARPSGHGRKRR